MTFTVEDGTGLEDSNSYCDVTFADSYFSDRGITGWSGSTEEKQTYLIRATDYIDVRFGQRFLGQILISTQALKFPRDVEGIPAILKKATAEYALRAKSAALAPDPVIDSSGMNLIENTKEVGPLKKSLKYAAGSKINIFKPYPAADQLLVSLLFPLGVVRN